MHDVNWWLTGLAFTLGLMLTLAMMIRRVTCTVGTNAGEKAGEAGEVGERPEGD